MNNIISKEYQAPILLIVIAVFLIVPVYITGRTDLPAATLVVASCACFFGAVFLMVTRPEEGIPADVASFFSIGLMESYARVAAELGASGPAHFIPDGNKVRQFNPARNFRRIPKPNLTAIVPEPESGGIFSVPSGMPVMAHLQRSGKLRIPHDMPDIYTAISEAERDLIHVADEVEVTEEGESVVVRFREFRFMPACEEIRSESMKICQIAPCPPCSLAGCILAAGTGAVWNIEGIAPSPEKNEMLITFTRMKDEHPPRDEGPDTRH
ncbi:hypothetical protein L0665_10395 [Methanogenium marinum]|uniref:DUF7982 domain-containing protein n=1 Tax=Methanogenium marinum TaxID=348610 RepID=A0A9Q4KUE3_9EURY|nr:hypothetical protein [Methanogenium marinum]MDE4909017.1 hypothetical protein [Methanogenium marinum]